MPAGLDGNPNPVATAARTHVLQLVGEHVLNRHGVRTSVGIDGRSGSGKSTFADELAATLTAHGTTVIRSTTDLFHRPREERMARGSTSASGYYLGSHQLETIIEGLLIPFSQGAVEVVVGAFDEPSDTARMVTAPVSAEAILIFDGLFIHRPELRRFWDLSIVLHADQRCDRAWLDYLELGLPDAPTERAAELDRRLENARWPRYREGWQRYLNSISEAAATIDIDNNDLENPRLLGE